MKNRHLDEDQLTLLYFKEAKESAGTHLASCADCERRYRDLAAFLDALHVAPVPQNEPDWEGCLWTQMSPKVTKILEGEHATSVASKRIWLLAPALAALIALAFLAGMYTQRHAAQPFSARARERVLLIALSDHMDRSQLVLAELVNAPEGKPANISVEQHAAGELLDENRLLRQTALRTGDRADAAVLEQLERVLLEVAHSPEELDARQLEAIQRRIEAPGLLFKIRVVRTNSRKKGMQL